MIDRKLLKDMANARITEMPPDHLRDVLDVEISGENPCQRMESYLTQLGNPYCFRVGKTPVQISFKLCEETLEKRLKSYFLGLKMGYSPPGNTVIGGGKEVSQSGENQKIG